MSWLKRLKDLQKTQDAPPPALTKPTKGGSVSFVSASPGASQLFEGGSEAAAAPPSPAEIDPEAAAAQRWRDRLADLQVEHFREDKSVVIIWSGTLNEKVGIVATEETRGLAPVGMVCYSAGEIEELGRVNLGAEALRQVHRLKRDFDGLVVEAEPEAAEETNPETP